MIGPNTVRTGYTFVVIGALATLSLAAATMMMRSRLPGPRRRQLNATSSMGDTSS